MSEDNNKVATQKRYTALDGLRAFAAIGIVIMHVKANMRFDISGRFYNDFISDLGNLAFLFMILSAFAMCCGYYDKIIENRISVNEFYSKRYRRIWPFFAILVLLDFVVSPGKDALMEAFADLTLLFSFLPNANISVIGVAWTLGVIFAFYVIFPFFCFLIGNKKRAWFSLAIALLLHITSEVYFMNSNHVLPSFNKDSNIVFCGVFFVIGGIIFLYKDEIVNYVNRMGIIALVLVVAGSVVTYCFIDNSSIKRIVIFTLWICYAIGDNRKILSCKFARILGGISMEIYLSHMLVLRIVQKLHLDKFVGNGVVAFLISCAAVLLGAIVFSYIFKYAVEKSGEYGKRKKNSVG